MEPEGSAWGRTIRTLFGLDLRSLALFRIALGTVLLADVAVRYQDLAAHYTDDGVLPRELMPPFNTQLCVHVLDGSLTYQAILFYLHGFAALALVLGWHTRFAVPVAWLLTTSVQARNILVLHGGDVLLRQLLFWSMFLPLSACYSLDSLTRASPPRRVASMGTVAFVLQLCMVYWFAGLMKWDDAWRKDGYALFMALNVGHFVTPLGKALTEHHGLLRFLSHATIFLEMFGPFLLFIPWRNWFFRLALFFLFAGFHAGIGLTMRMGAFQWVCVIAWTALLPGELWDWLERRLRRPLREGLRICRDTSQSATGSLRFWTTVLMLPGIETVSAQDNPAWREQFRGPEGWFVLDSEGRAHAGMDGLVLLFRASPVFWPLAFLVRFKPLYALGNRMFRPRDAGPAPAELPPAVKPLSGPLNMLIASLLLYVAAWNLNFWNEPHGPNDNFVLTSLLNFRDEVQKHFPPQARTLAHALGLEQGWGLFAPHPGTVHGWVVIAGTLEDGRQIDLLRNIPLTWEKPEFIAETYPSARWRQYIMHLSAAGPGDMGIRHPAAVYFADAWNEEHPPEEQLKTAEIYHMRETTQPDYQPPKLEKWRLSKYDCASMLSDLIPVQEGQ